MKSKLEQLNDIINNSTKEELIWMAGYLEGVVRNFKAEAVPASVAPVSAGKVTVLYGTETGNSKVIATETASRLKKEGIPAKLMAMEQYRNLTDLGKEDKLLVVMSTHGEGEPPVAAKKFYDFVLSNKMDLRKVSHAVLALGDTSYPLFCKAGEDVDLQLEKWGSKRLTSLHKADVDYAETAESWIGEVLKSLKNGSSPATNGTAVKAIAKPSGKKIYTGVITTNLNLNDRGSSKQTHHIEIETEEPVDYLPGDSIGIVAENSAETVQAILNLLQITEPQVTWRSNTYSPFELLKTKVNITWLPHRQVHQYSGIVQQEIPDGTRIDLLDLVKIYPPQNNVQAKAVLEMLEPIAPRLYSISSSPAAHENSLHITVSKHNFWLEDDQRYGLCSGWLNELPEGTSLQFYVHRNTEFRLPAEDKDVIMIGPGTGIAPFRSFLFERDANGASGRNWLFFGDQHFVTDFLYQSELQQLADTGVLTRINTAFSRDQQEKIYVQHKLQKHAAEVFNWLQNGASIYICGAKEPMSVDVENTLLQIIQQQGDSTLEEAEEYLLQLKEDGRYRKDVY
jgi:sulfite reductase (NADPH) flavoprotein alpha-component